MITGKTRLACIIGDPAEQSLSPQMHNAAFKAGRLDWVYLAFNVSSSELAYAVGAIRVLGIEGANVTMPHKNTVVALLDDLSPEAKAIGTVNTIVNNKGKLKGYNTDIEGFRRALAESGFDPKGKKAFVIGAGGAARAVAEALASGGAKSITVACRNEGSAVALAEIAGRHGVSTTRYKISKEAAHAAREADLIVNATPLGRQTTDNIKFLVDELNPKQFVADLSTVPPLSAYLVAAQERGCTVMGGLGMLVHQGSLSYRLWTGQEPSLDAMKKAVGADR